MDDTETALRSLVDGFVADRSPHVDLLLDMLEAIRSERRALLIERDRLRAALADVVEHATPIAEDDDGFVSVGYTVTVGAIHRAIAALQGAAPLDVSPEATDG